MRQLLTPGFTLKLEPFGYPGRESTGNLLNVFTPNSVACTFVHLVFTDLCSSVRSELRRYGLQGGKDVSSRSL